MSLRRPKRKCEMQVETPVFEQLRNCHFSEAKSNSYNGGGGQKAKITCPVLSDSPLEKGK